MASKKVRLNDTEIEGKLGNGKNSRANKDVKTFYCTAGLTDSQVGSNNSAQYESDNVQVLRVTSTIDASDMDGIITGCGPRSDGCIQTESVSVRRKITNPINIYLPNDQDLECNETENVEGEVGVCGTVRELSLSTDPGYNHGPSVVDPFNVSESTSAKGLKSGRKEFRLRGEHHVFTVVPVESSGTIVELEEPKTPDPDSVVKSNKRLNTDKDSLTPIEQVTQGSSLYNTVKGTTSVPCPHTSYNPYLTVNAAGPSPKIYNPYHTISGLYPSSYQRSEFRQRRVSSHSRREYGVGQSSLSPSLVSMVHQTRGMTGSLIASKGSLKGMATPSNSTNRFQQQTCVPLWSDDNSATSVAPDEATIHSLNQMTVRSAGGVSVGVGSTDGRNMTVRGAVASPEQLPLLPDTLK
ncbi:hypothetical protein Pmani_028251 [Petrolisthes manimaculis]|uniref:Uncharacterized protein n=1 Tax=Petrolisthes manimaculis TaxID=1843537 RepID=A0AAE1TVW1_9EUCA|nr:hypothetical protein Pmani_028251 [Petrolisthes manimaculis]